MITNLDVKNKFNELLKQKITECGMGEISAPTIEATVDTTEITGDGSGDIPNAFTEDSDSDDTVLSFKTFKQRGALDEAVITFKGKTYPKSDNILILAGGGGCFEGNTLVKTETGYKPIKDIQKGEKVYTINEDTKAIELKEVERLNEFTNIENPELIELTFDNGEVVICTPDHEFLIDGNWIKAKDL